MSGPLSPIVRENWRAIDVVDLTDAEVELMSDAEVRWCLDLLRERRLKLSAPKG
jgi:hypothetical protein